MRLVAYCRVSTNKDEQLESLENQKAFFVDIDTSYHKKFTIIFNKNTDAPSRDVRKEHRCLFYLSIITARQ